MSPKVCFSLIHFDFSFLLTPGIRKNAGMTTGTPIHVFVPNTDQRGLVSFSLLYACIYIGVRKDSTLLVCTYVSA